MLRHALRMSNQFAAVKLHSLVRKLSAPETTAASDALPIMRRQLKLLNIEVEHLRGKADEASKIKEFLAEYVDRVEQLRENRDQWQREAERLNALIAQVPHWSLLWARCCLNVSTLMIRHLTVAEFLEPSRQRRSFARFRAFIAQPFSRTSRPAPAVRPPRA